MGWICVMLALLLGGCVTVPPPPAELSAKAQGVQVSKELPGTEFVEIAPISVSDGAECGKFGYLGTFDRAYIFLKNKAADMGADFVQIISINPPHYQSMGMMVCFLNVFEIHALAFKRKAPVGH